MASTDEIEVSNIDEEGAANSASMPLADMVKDLEKTIDNATEAVAAISMDSKAVDDHLPSHESSLPDKYDTKISLIEYKEDDQMSENLSQVKPYTVDEKNSGIHKSDTSEPTKVLESNREPSNANGNTIAGTGDHLQSLTTGSDNKSASSSKINSEAYMISNNFMPLSKHLLDLPTSNSPATATDRDSLSSEMQDEMVLKWDDEDDEIEPNESKEKDPQDAITIDKEKYVTKDLVLDEKDMLDKIDAQISGLNSKSLVPEVSGSSDEDKDGTDQKMSKETRTSPNAMKTIDSQEKSHPLETAKDSVEKNYKSSNQTDVDSVNVTVDSIIANLDQIIDGKNADDNETATTAKFDDNIALHLVTNVNLNLPSDDKNVQNIHLAENKPTSHMHLDQCENKMDLDPSNVIIEDKHTKTDEEAKTVDLPSDDMTTDVQNINIAENRPTSPTYLDQCENKMDLDPFNVIIEDKHTKTDEEAKAVAEADLTRDAVDNMVDLDASDILEEGLIATDLDESMNDTKITANSTEIELNINEDTEGVSINVDDKLIEEIKYVPNSSIALDMSTSDQDITIETKEHNLKQPDMMIEIPTQELITLPDDTLDISDKDLSTSHLSKDDKVVEVIKTNENMQQFSKNVHQATDKQELKEVVANLLENDKDIIKIDENVTVLQQQELVDKSDNMLIVESELVTDIDNITEVVDKSKTEELKSDSKDVEGNSSKTVETESVDEIPFRIEDQTSENLTSKTKEQIEIESIASLEKEQVMKTENQMESEDLPCKDKDQASETKDALMNTDITSVNQDLISKHLEKVEQAMETENQMIIEVLPSKDKDHVSEIKDTPSISEDMSSIKQGLISKDLGKDQAMECEVNEIKSEDLPSKDKDKPSEIKDKPITDEMRSIRQGLISKDLEKIHIMESEDLPSKDKDQTSEAKDSPSINDYITSVNQDLLSKDKDQHSENNMPSMNENMNSVNQDLVTKDQSEHKDTASINDDKTSLNQELISKDHKEVDKENTAGSDKEPSNKVLLPKDNPPSDIVQSLTEDIVSNLEHSLDENEPQMAADTSDEVPDLTDSLGLLAESSRVMEDDEEQETSDHDDGDDEEDFDPDDESSNQMTAEHSEDSNAQNSETDMSKDKPADVQTNLQTDIENVQEFIAELETPDAEKPEFNFAITNVMSGTLLTDKDGEEVDDNMADDVDGDVSTDMMGDDIDVSTPLEAEDTASPGMPAELEAEVELETETAEDVEMTEHQIDLETVRLSDTSDTEENAAEELSDDASKLRKLLIDGCADDYFRNKEANKIKGETARTKKSPAKTKKLEISKPKDVVNYVDLEETSSEDDIQEITKRTEPAEASDDVTTVDDDVTNVNIPSQIEIMSSGENTSNIVTKEGEIVISGVPKPPPHKLARLNTSEVTIKTASTTESTLVIPEAKATDEKCKPKLGLEVFSLDSDDEDSTPAQVPTSPSPEPPKPTNNHCINNQCTSDNSVSYFTADPSTVAYYNANKKQKPMVCQLCADAVTKRAQTLVEGIRNMTPLMELDMSRLCEELVEISDSDSEESVFDDGGVKETIGEEGARLLEEQLSEVMNATWQKYDMDARLGEAQDELTAELARLETMGKEIDAIFDECQAATDALRNRLYTTFEPKRQELPPIVVFDTPDNQFACTESAELVAESGTQVKKSKRRLSSASETPPKRAAIPLGYAPLDDPVQAQAQAPADSEPVQSQSRPATPPVEPPQETKPVVPSTSAFVSLPSDTSKIDDDKDISVVNLSAEQAPADLPPPGEVVRAPLRSGMPVYAMRNAFGSWLRARVFECTPKGSTPQSTQFTMCRVKFESKTHKNAFKQLPARCLAYSEPSDVRMTIGTRVIALFKDSTNVSKRESYYSGVVAEVPNPVNNYRYLVFFDDGYAQYVRHADTRLVCEFSPLVWEEVHPFSREFVREYLLAYPERPMVRLHTGQTIKTEWNGKWWFSRVIQVDASLVHVHFQEDNRTEWIYRGSTRLAPLYLELQAAERHRARPLPRNRAQTTGNMPYVEYTRSDEPPPARKPQDQAQTQAQSQAQVQEEIRRQRSVAKKSTGAPLPLPYPPPPPAQSTRVPPVAESKTEAITSRVVYYTPKNAVKPYRLTPHACSHMCRRSDVLALKDLRTYNPLAKPLLSGWERQLVRFKGHKGVMYRAPCGRRLRNMSELHRYLRKVQSDMGVDLFDFDPSTHCLAEFVLNKCIIAKKDLSNGKENVPVPCVNYYDHSLPEFCSYNTERTPTEGVPLNIDPEFLCGCDCTDDCVDKSKCACWQMTLEGARTIGLSGALGYKYKRLLEPLPSGIYECNSRCKCKSTCLNRVAQHPLQLKLQVFKTLNRGWGIRALNDVPKGAFLCVYAGNLLTDATANMDGLIEGDEYLAELDYIEVVEQMKEGFEEDIPDADKKLDKVKSEEDSDDMSSSEEEEETSRGEKEDGDFEPGYIGRGLTQFSKRLRKRQKAKRGGGAARGAQEGGGEGGGGDCITISDDEEVREPSRFMAQAGMGANEFISKYRSVRSLFGKDEACYIMDAKVQGNIGRYLNHSCSPNVFVQNVFVDTHDPRFPWVSFFALLPIRAGTELTWNYNYDVGSVPGKALYCYCGAHNCRGRLL